jgi:hypothetical protein
VEDERKMRVCPKCGYRDPPIWRNTARRLYQEHCHITDLELWNPKLADILKNQKFVCINGVKYKLNPKGTYVHRIDAHLCAYPRENDPRITEPNKEKHKARVLPARANQRRLDEEIKP